MQRDHIRPEDLDAIEELVRGFLADLAWYRRIGPQLAEPPELVHRASEPQLVDWRCLLAHHGP
ncbi:MAG TPA: hypothetical protein VIR16_01720 [Candidatus Limnocylindrales bacterium]